MAVGRVAVVPNAEYRPARLGQFDAILDCRDDVQSTEQCIDGSLVRPKIDDRAHLQRTGPLPLRRR